MKLLVRPSRLRGEIAVPGSKSHTIRGLAAGLMCDGSAVLHAPLDSADTRSALNAIRSLGAQVKECPGRWEIRGCGGRCRKPDGTIDMGNSGTGLRLLCAMAARQNFPVSFDGDSSLRSRPMAGLLKSLEQLGARSVSADGRLPLTVQGPLCGGHAIVEGRTSQYLTALLLALPGAEGDSVLELESLNEQPYIRITMQWLDALGIRYCASPDLLHWEIPGKQKIPSFERVIPADFSTASFPLAAAALTGGEVTIRNLDFSDAQGDKEVFADFEKMGALLVRGPELLVRGPARLAGCVLDLNATPDALPVLAVAGAAAEGETRITHVAQARLKETDRIAVMSHELRKMGADVEELPDGMVLRGRKLRGAAVESHGDHRVAMALAIAGMAAEGETLIAEAESAAVSYPEFFDAFRKLGADFTLLP